MTDVHDVASILTCPFVHLSKLFRLISACAFECYKS